MQPRALLYSMLGAAALVAVACFPKVEGAPCHGDDNCPEGQFCSADNTCRFGTRDGGGGSGGGAGGGSTEPQGTTRGEAVSGAVLGATAQTDPTHQNLGSIGAATPTPDGGLDVSNTQYRHRGGFGGTVR